MATRYITSWDAAEFTVLSGSNPFSDYNDANSSAIGSIFTVGQAELLTIEDGPDDGGSNSFNESDDDQVFVSSSDPDGRNAAAGTEIDVTRDGNTPGLGAPVKPFKYALQAADIGQPYIWVPIPDGHEKYDPIGAAEAAKAAAGEAKTETNITFGAQLRALMYKNLTYHRRQWA